MGRHQPQVPISMRTLEPLCRRPCRGRGFPVAPGWDSIGCQVTRTVTGEVTVGAVRDPVPATGTDLPTRGTAVDGAAAMTLVQVKRPHPRPDTAEVVPTVTREVDDEGVMKAYRGDDAPRGRRTWCSVSRAWQPRIRPPPTRSPRVHDEAPHHGHDNDAAMARTRGRFIHSEPRTMDWSRPFVEEAMTRETTFLTVCQGRGRRRPRGGTCAVRTSPWGLIPSWARQRRRESRHAPSDVRRAHSRNGSTKTAAEAGPKATQPCPAPPAPGRWVASGGAGAPAPVVDAAVGILAVPDLPRFSPAPRRIKEIDAQPQVRGLHGRRVGLYAGFCHPVASRRPGRRPSI